MYSRRDCPLCDEAREELARLAEEFPHRLIEVDVDSEPTLVRRYGDHVPVLEIGPYTLTPPFSMTDLRVTLAAARDGVRGEATSAPVNRQTALTLNKGLLFFASHWLAIFNLLVFLYVGLPFAAPALMKAGLDTPARLIYTAYSPFCHQLAFRSWFLFGEQPAYPRALAGTDWKTFSEATGIDENDFWAARRFLGNDQVGYKVALCERDVAIYGGIFLAGLAFALVRHRLRPLPFWAWVLFGIVPIALDGGTQLVFGLPFLPFPPRESTPFLRTLTGALFGVMNVWLAYPHLEASMAETRAVIAAKLARAQREAGATADHA